MKTSEENPIFLSLFEEYNPQIVRNKGLKKICMNLLEPLVFKKLNEYREQANRERFILPEDKNIDFFKDTIKNCLEFLK